MGGRESATEALSEEVYDSVKYHQPPPDPSSVPHSNTLEQGRTSTPSDTNNVAAIAQNARLPGLDTLTTDLPRFHLRTPSAATPRTPLGPLHIVTTPTPSTTTTHRSSLAQALDQSGRDRTGEQGSRSSESNSIPIQRAGSLRSTLSAASMHSISPSGSRISSPMLNALSDITPLPSPLAAQDSPVLWKTRSRPGSTGSTGSLGRSLREEVLLDIKKGSPTNMKPKSYGTLVEGAEDGSDSATAASHKSNRSISEFQPGPLHNERPRIVTIGNITTATADPMHLDSALHREKYLAEQRGLAQPRLPTPPPSNWSMTGSEADEGYSTRDDNDFIEYLTVRQGPSKQKRRYRAVRPLGQGTFSKVMLATSEKLPTTTKLDEASESILNPRNLVAIKVVQHGPAGGADAERIDVGLKREIEILREVSHPSIIHLKAFDYSDQEALIVLNYCPGGDLFDLASQWRELLTPTVVRRMFSELVGATRYLHSLWIVHRDIKLENVLLNMPATALREISDPLTYPYPLITLTDLGLSRKIPHPPESPLLTTRCGSEDYAAPEILLGQPYDGRSTDAWAIGVLTYALIEGKLPFDPPPPRPGRKTIRSKASHRVARCEWIWSDYGDEDGEWDDKLGAGWEGARDVVDGLLKKVNRGRVTLDMLASQPYVKDAIACEGGLQRPPHADDDEDL